MPETQKIGLTGPGDCARCDRRGSLMRRIAHRMLCLTGMAAYAVFASGLTSALHASLAHSDHHVSTETHGHSGCTPLHDHEPSHDSHGESHAPDCPTCYQIASAANAALTLAILLPLCGDTSSRHVVHSLQLTPAAEILSSIAPRAPPLA